MTFKRILYPTHYSIEEKLTSDLVGIGFRLAARRPDLEPNIEDTLIAASLEGIRKSDFRLISLLVDWIQIHSSRINVDRLSKIAAVVQDDLVKAFWTGIGHWLSTDPRMLKLAKISSKPRRKLFGEAGDYRVSRFGEDDRFKGSAIIIPAGSLRSRPDDILSPSELAHQHSTYRWRILIGPTYRADMWALLEAEGNMRCMEIARRSYGSWPTAFAVMRDWALLHPDARGNSKIHSLTPPKAKK